MSEAARTNRDEAASLLRARIAAWAAQGADALDVRLVTRLLDAAEAERGPARERLLARVDARLPQLDAPVESETTATEETVAEETVVEASSRDRWDELLRARAAARKPREQRARRATTLVAEVRARAATSRAKEKVPETAGPYNGASVAARTLAELAALAPGYVSGYVAWLEDLAALAELPERKSAAPERRSMAPEPRLGPPPRRSMTPKRASAAPKRASAAPGEGEPKRKRPPKKSDD